MRIILPLDYLNLVLCYQPNDLKLVTVCSMFNRVDDLKFVLRVMRKSKKRAGQYIASRFLKDSPESLLTELLKNAGKTWTSRSL